MKAYISPQTKILSGRTIGFAHIDRLSTLSVKTAQKIDWHRHDEVEILCCLKGSLVYEFRQRAPVSLPAGCFMVIPPGIEHRLAGGIDGPCRRFSFFLKESPTRKPKPSPILPSEMRELLALLLKKRIKPQIIRESVLLHITRLANLLDSARTPTLIERLAARSDSLAAILSFASTQKEPVLKNTTRLMDEAVQWLERHYNEQITMDQLITYMGYSRSRFFSLFKSHTGQSPIEWLTRFRVERAKQLLTTTDADVSAIAKSCGFADPAFFARAFRRRVGNSPTGFRKESP